VATGLTTPQFVEPAPERGETATYRIVAVGTNGISPMSSPLKLLQNKKRKPMED
jgi:hypothetical protein